MTLVLLAAEIALFLRLLLTAEFLRRPCFFIFILASIYGATHYSHSREDWVRTSIVYSVAIGLPLLESLCWLCQRSHVLQVLAFGIAFAAFTTHWAIGELSEATFGSDVKTQTLIMSYYCAFWLFTVGFVLVNPAVRMQGGRVRQFDWTLLVWLATKAGFRIAGYYLPGGTKNADWPFWNAASTMLLTLCMVAWLFGNRLLDDLHHDAIADERRYDQQKHKKKVMLQDYASH